jgi:hypothetical protein
MSSASLNTGKHSRDLRMKRPRFESAAAAQKGRVCCCCHANVEQVDVRTQQWSVGAVQPHNIHSFLA